MRRISLILTLLLLALRLSAGSISDERPLTTTYQLGIGRTRALNTYLSPIPYCGTAYSLSGEWSRQLRTELPLRQTYEARFGLGNLLDKHGLSAMTDIDLLLAWWLEREFSPIKSLKLGAGAGLQLDGGMLYLPRNSNNPVAARASASLTLNASARYDLRIGRLPIRLFEQVTLPSLGVFFSPHYGQSYFEIYLGDRSGLVRCGWWGNRLQVRNTVGAEVPVCSIRLRAAYRLGILSSLASGINTRITTHEFVLGLSTDWVNVTRKQATTP